MAKNRRKSKGKKINPTLFVFCEGDTEEAYINMLKSHFRLSSIQVNPKISGSKITSKFIKNYKKDKPTHSKDINYLMYDLDVPEIFTRLKKIKDCILLLSNPSIEIWFLLHYKNHKANNDSAYFCKELKKRNKRYKKGVIDKKLKEKLTEKYKDAMKRAKALNVSKNPSSTIFMFLEKLEELKK